MTQPERHIFAALTTLIVLQLIMLAALLAGVRPHPPEVITISGMAPLLAVSIAIALSALIVQPLGSVSGRGLSILAGLLALLSFGPQKYLDEQFGLTWPAVVLAQVAVLVILVRVVLSFRGQSERVDAVPGSLSRG